MRDELRPQTIRGNSEDTSTNDPSQRHLKALIWLHWGLWQVHIGKNKNLRKKLLDLEAPREGCRRCWLFRKSWDLGKVQRQTKNIFSYADSMLSCPLWGQGKSPNNHKQRTQQEITMTGRIEPELSIGLGGAEVLTWGRASEVRAGNRVSAGAGQTGVVWPGPSGWLTAPPSPPWALGSKCLRPRPCSVFSTLHPFLPLVRKGEKRRLKRS